MKYRAELHDAVAQTFAAAVGGSPWDADAEASLNRLQAALDAAIDADPYLAQAFDRSPSAAIVRDEQTSF